jgi:hypothetical protein
MPKRRLLGRDPVSPDVVIVEDYTEWQNPFEVGENFGVIIYIGGRDEGKWGGLVGAPARLTERVAGLMPGGDRIVMWSQVGTPETAVALYDTWVREPDRDWVRNLVRRELRGKDLACRCPLDAPCHVDVLLEIANPGWVQ